VTEIGYNSTYNYGIVIFIPIAATFGQTYALNYVSPYAWVKTEWKRKLLRSIIALVIMGSLLKG